MRAGIATVTAIAVLLATPALAATADDGRSLVFDIIRSGKKAGTHTIRFRQQGEDLTVDVGVRITGRMFLVPFSYVHENREIWRGDKLQRIDTKTQTNSKAEAVTGRATSAGFEVRVGANAVVLPANVLPTSYWHPDTPNRKSLLNTQKGNMASVVTEQIVSTSAATARGKRAANEYRFVGGVKANVVYDGDGCFVGLSFKMPVDGSKVVYKLVAQPDPVRAPDLLANPLLAPCVRPIVRTAMNG
jgi:Family of unknown function (DUF6134)